MKFERTERFRSDYAGLSIERRELVRDVLAGFLRAADEVGARNLDPRAWPGAFRVHALSGAPGICSVTFNHRRPDLRATFEWTSTVDGEPVLRWRRIGSHAIYTEP